jgi:hypothetical protein
MEEPIGGAWVKGEGEIRMDTIKVFCTLYENRILKATKIYSKEGRGIKKRVTRGSDFDQSTLYTCVEISQ